MRHPISLRLLTVTLVLLCPVSRLEAAEPPASLATAVSNAPMTATLMRLPLQFEANQGQVDEHVRFLARGPGYTLFLTPSESVLVLQQRELITEAAQHKRSELIAMPEPPAIKQAVVRMRLEGANPAPAMEGMEQLPGIVSYFIGNDPAKWRTHIPTYAKVQYQEVYPGIDLAYYGNQGTVEYDFIVAPGADPNQIRLAFEGASALHLADSGDLLLATALDSLRVKKPLIYQLDPEGHKSFVAGHYIVERQTANVRSAQSTLSTEPARPQVSIQLAAYDHTKPIIIDPVLQYSTYLGGSDFEEGSSIAVDGDGQAYVTGPTHSLNFPTLNASQPAFGGNGDAFVTKLTANGALAYSTYLGGSNEDAGSGIAVDESGQAYVTGFTLSGDFPMLNASQPTLRGFNDAFVTKLTTSGGLAYSTYLGASDGEQGSRIAVDGSGQAYVTGFTESVDFPTLNASQPAFGGAVDAFVTKFTVSGALAYSTYLGGSEAEQGSGIAVDGSGQVYVTGFTNSDGNFPILNASQPAFGGIVDAFVTKLTASGALAYSTYLGGSDFDTAGSIAVDRSGQVYVTGFTQSVDFPTLNASQPALRGFNDAFVTKLTASGALAYSTYLGGNNSEGGSGIAVDGSGQASVTGQTFSTDFPTAMPLQATPVGSTNVFVTTFNATGTALRFSTYLGGSGPNQLGTSIAVDGAGQIYVTGITESTDFPTVTPIQATHIGGIDPFVAKISALVTNQPPVCRAAQASPAMLWAPNHQFVPITIIGVTDPDEDAVTITVTGVTQDEPVNAKGDGNTSPDAVIQARAASVRAERSGNGNGRVYHIAFTADDGHGNSCSGTVTVGVPHSQKKGLTAIDDGQRYTSTSP